MRHHVRTGIILIALFLLVNVLLSVYLWLPGASFLGGLVPIPESTVFFLFFYLLRRKGPFRMTVGALLGFFIAYSVVEGAIQYVYARSFVPQTDIPMITGLLYLLFGTIGEWAVLLRPLVMAVILAFFAGIGIAVGEITTAFMRRLNPGRSVMAGMIFLTGLATLFTPAPQLLAYTATTSWRGNNPEEFVDIVLEETPPADETEEQLELPVYRFPGLKDRDVYIFAIEAYGYATFSREELAEQIAPARDRFAAVLYENGYKIRSNFYLSPVAGGFSWLAEATFFTGQWIDSQKAFDVLKESEFPTLPGVFYNKGYHTVAFKPGMVHGSWPEGWDMFRFRESLVAYDGDFDYQGPWFSFVPITDQFTLWTAHHKIGEFTASGGGADTQPFLAYFQLVSSHTPFNRIPPVIGDWNTLGNGTIYHDQSERIRTFQNSWTGGSEMDEGYSTAISYVFEVLADYLANHADLSDSPVFIVFGDHQAQRPIREAQAHLSVPVHIATRDTELLDRLETIGFRDGLNGGQPPPHQRLSTFFPAFVTIAQGDLK